MLLIARVALLCEQVVARLVEACPPQDLQREIKALPQAKRALVDPILAKYAAASAPPPAARPATAPPAAGNRAGMAAASAAPGSSVAASAGSSLRNSRAGSVRTSTAGKLPAAPAAAASAPAAGDDLTGWLALDTK